MNTTETISKLFPADGFAPQLLASVPFVQYLASPGISKSILDKFKRSPLDALDAIMRRDDDGPTHAMVIGSLVDGLIFERSDMAEAYYVRPETYVAEDGEEKKWNGNAKACRYWLATHADRPIISKPEEASIQRMAEAVANHPKVKAILRDVMPQCSFFARDPETGLLIKGRPDWAGDIVIDLKSTRDAETGAFAKQMTNMRYPVQAGHYARGMELCVNKIKAAYYIAVEGGERPQVNVRKLDAVSFEAGKEQARRDLVALAECARSGVWPDLSGPGEEIGEIKASAWWVNQVFDLDNPMSLAGIEEVDHAEC